MALVASYRCVRCDTERHELVPKDRVCSHCREEDARIAGQVKRTTLWGLHALTPEERLAHIEDTIYDLADLKRRIEALETHNATY